MRYMEHEPPPESLPEDGRAAREDRQDSDRDQSSSSEQDLHAEAQALFRQLGLSIIDHETRHQRRHGVRAGPLGADLADFQILPESDLVALARSLGVDGDVSRGLSSGERLSITVYPDRYRIQAVTLAELLGEGSS
jgi:hypothetical protein